MGQEIVLNALDCLRKINDKWHTSREVITYIKTNYKGINNIKGIYTDLLKLAEFRLIEIRGVGMWEHHKEFRGLLINEYKSK
jgi:hypothetical protein